MLYEHHDYMVLRSTWHLTSPSFGNLLVCSSLQPGGQKTKGTRKEGYNERISIILSQFRRARGVRLQSSESESESSFLWVWPCHAYKIEWTNSSSFQILQWSLFQPFFLVSTFFFHELYSFKTLALRTSRAPSWKPFFTTRFTLYFQVQWTYSWGVVHSCGNLALWDVLIAGFPAKTQHASHGRGKKQKQPVAQSLMAQPGAHCYASFSRRMKVESPWVQRGGIIVRMLCRY